MVNYKEFFIKLSSITKGKLILKKGFVFSAILLFQGFITISPAVAVQYGFFTSYDHQLIRIAKIPSKQETSKGTIVLLQGMGGFIEYYLDIMNSMSNKGFDVLTMDWRGQGDSGRFTEHPTLLYVDNFDSYVKDLHVFLSNNKQLKRPIIFLASSMGGNIAIHYVQKHPKKVDAVIALAPMIKINTHPYPYPLAQGLVNLLVSMGMGKEFVFGYEPFSYDHCVQNYNPLKNGDKTIYLRDCDILKKQPRLAIGGPSFQWLKAAFKASQDLENEKYLKEIKTPFLIVASEQDYLVNTEAQINLCQRLPNCQLQVYQDSHHNILKDANPIVKRLIKDVDVFYVNLHKTNNSTPSQQMVYQENTP